jgi:hypothetical protein
MSFDFDEMLRSKQALRQRLTSLPIAEKLRLLDALRARAIAIRPANRREPLTAGEEPTSYDKR